MKKFIAIVLSLIMALAPVCVYAQDAIGTLTYTEGRVDRTQEGAFDYVPVVKEEPVHAGDVLRTKSNSMAEVRFTDGSTVRLGENTQLRIPQYSFDQDGKREKAQLFVDRGVVRAIVEKAKDKQANFLIDTPNMRGAIKGSDIVVGFQRSMTNLVSFEGQIQAQSIDFPDDVVVVTPGNTSAMSASAPPAAPRKFLPVEKQRFEAETTPRAKDEIAPKDLSKAVITKYTGDVRVKSATAREWHRVGLKETIGEGDQVETGENGTVRVLLESGRTVDLKGGTHLGIKQLKVDTKTGMREDVLESLRGQLRANIDKRAGRETSFRVVTPTAVASVRGTILYLQVMPGKVTSYFEQGHGSLLGLLKNVESQLQPGQAASIGADGESTGPYIPTQEEIDRFRAEWGDEQYGYSPSNSGNQGGSFDGTDENDGPDGGPDGGDDNENNLFDQVQQTPGNDNGNGPTPITIAKWGDSERDEASLYVNAGGTPVRVAEEFGDLVGIAPWDAEQSFSASGDFEVSGDFEPEGEQPENPVLYWHTPLSSRIVPEGEISEDVEISDAAADGGANFGYTAGLWSAGKMLGSLAMLFIGPGGNAGLLTGFVDGTTDDEDSTWTATGAVIPTTLSQMPDLDAANFQDYVEWGYMYGSFFGEMIDGEGAPTGQIRSEVYESSANFLWDRDSSDRSELWGVFDFFLGGGSYNDVAGSGVWAGVFGGEVAFGRYFQRDSGSEYPEAQEDYGYWLGLAGGVLEDGAVYGLFEGAYLTETQLGILGGEIFGASDLAEAGTWSGAGVGTFVGRQLTFFTEFGNWLTDPWGGYDGYLEAYMGSADTLFGNESASTILIGWIDTFGGDDHVWFDDLTSTNAYKNDSTTYEGGAFYGYLGGNQHDDSIAARFAGLYIAPDGSAGFLEGAFEGESYEDLGLDMFQMQGEILRRKMTDDLGIDPADLWTNLSMTEDDGELSGVFDGTDAQITAYDNLYTASFVNYERGEAAPWGIYGQEIYGRFDNPGDATTWTATMGGNDAFGVYNPVMEHYAQYYYYPGGESNGRSYYYDYTQNGGYVYEYDPNGEYYVQYYYSDGTWSRYDYWTGESTSGTWDPSTQKLADLIGAPPDPEENPEVSYSGDYGSAERDRGYWLAGVNGTLQNNDVSATLEGRFLTATKTGTMSGDMLGAYNNNDGNAWTATGIGTWEGSRLAFSGIWGSEEEGDATSLYYNDGGYLAWLGEEYGLVGAVSAPWDVPASYVAMGGFYTDSYDVDDLDGILWNSVFQSRNVELDDDSSLGGGAFWGFSAGLWRNGAINGSVAALYVDPDGNVGVLRGGALGSYYTDLEMWSIDGTLTATQTGSREGIDAANLDNWVMEEYLNPYSTGNFAGEEGSGGYFDPYEIDFSRTYFLESYDGEGRTPASGLFSIRFEDGEYYNPEESDTFFAAFGGDEGTFGYRDGGDEYDDGYWVVTATGDWSDYGFSGELDGDYLTRHQMGTMQGELSGLYDEYYDYNDGYFVGQALGTFTGGYIDFNGDWGYQESSLYGLESEGNYGQLSWYGEEYGWIGAITSPWNAEGGSSAFLAMGDYWTYGDGDQNLIWSTPFQSVNYDEYNYTTYDGGAFWGSTQGLWADGRMRGSVALLYTDGDGKAGIIRGNADGDYYEELGDLWRVEGVLSVAHSEEIGYWLDVEYFGYGDNIYTGSFEEFELNGDFNADAENNNYFHGEADWDAYTYFLYPWDGGLADNSLDRTPTFGLIDFFIEGDGFSLPYGASEWEAALGGYGTFGRILYDNGEGFEERNDEGFWFATGTGGWADGLVDGSFEGAYLTGSQFGSVEGDLAGLYSVNGSDDGDVYGSFAAAGLGAFIGQPLSFAGQVVGGLFDLGSTIEDFGGIFGEGEGPDLEVGFMEGLMGGFGNLWASATEAVPAHFMGYFEGSSEGAQSFLSFFTSYDVFENSYDTFDNGAFVGFMAGRWAGEETAGHVRAFYVDPDGTLGYLSGSLTGNNADLGSGEDNYGLWRLDGELTATPMGDERDFEGLEGFYDIDTFFEEFEPAIALAAFEDGDDYLAMVSICFGVGGGNDNENDDDNWGLWFGFLSGEFNVLDDGAFRRPMAGIVISEHEVDGEPVWEDDTAFLGTVRGNLATVESSEALDQGTFDAAFQGVWVSEEDGDPFLTAGTINGDFSGNFERTELVTTLEAAGAGEYVRLTELDPAKVGYDMDTLKNFLEMPITESQAGLLTAMTGGIQGTMDASFFANTVTDLGGIWTAIFNGTFDTTPGSTWTFAGDGISATLNNVQWLTENQQWLADVTGTLPGVPQGFTGQAGGTFTNPLDDAPGTLTGVGTGVWGTGPQEPA